jgi:hypothetical protein
MNKEHFFSFAPKDDIEGNDEAFNALNFSLNYNNKIIHNIAISGPYGAGKSSLWRTYKKSVLSKEIDGYELPKKDDIIDISLAKFEEGEKNKGKSDNLSSVTVNVSNSNINDIKNEKSEKSKIINANNVNNNQDEEKIEYEIEKAILQQMLFGVRKEKIPCLDSYKISEGNVWKNIILSISIVFLFILWIRYYFEEVINLICYGLNEKFASLFYGVIIFLSIFLCVLLYRCIVKAGNIHICNFTFKGLDVSFEQSSGSLINQNYSAIVYFFEKTKKRVVAFEDLDRFSSIKIFVKLRELNTILNNCPSLKDEIKFVYMVKDNLFTKYERTKFFEIIIPVLPVVNMEACADFLLNEKKQQNEEKKKNEEKRNINGDFQKEPLKNEDYPLINVDDKLLRIVGGYINDLRIIYDCLNEFTIYRKQLENDLKSVNGIENKIFAMVVYKNYYPQDFEDLHRHRGYLYEICKIIKISDINDTNRKKIIKQCLKLEKKIKYGHENEEVYDLLEKDMNDSISSLLLELVESGYIDHNCEFYVSRKYLGDLSLNDCRYFINIQSKGKPDPKLRIEKLGLLEEKIKDSQWESVSVLNNRMFAYELSINDKMILKNLISAIYKAEKQNIGFFHQFIEYLESEVKNHRVIVKDEVYTIESEETHPTIKELLWDAIYENMNENTLSLLFGEVNHE